MLPKLFRQTILNKLSQEEPLKTSNKQSNLEKIRKLKMLKDYLCNEVDLLSFKKGSNKRFHTQHSVEYVHKNFDHRRCYTIDNTASKKSEINKPMTKKLISMGLKQQSQNAQSNIFAKKKTKRLNQLFELRNSNKLTSQISFYRNNLSQKLALYKLR